MSTHHEKKVRDQSIIRAQATRQVMEKTNRLLGWDGKVKVIPPNHNNGLTAVPAWTDGGVITINGTQQHLYKIFRDGYDRDAMLWLSGLNYHELSHCFFTPRVNSRMVIIVQQRGHFMAMNALEDQSAESKFVRLYNPARHYFTAVITKMMLNNDLYVQMNYPLIAGRKYLPKELRKQFRDEYLVPEQIPEIDRIVSEYCDCVYPTDEDKMLHLIGEFHELINEMQQQTGMSPDLTSHTGDGTINDDSHPDKGIREGEVVSVSVQREATEKPQEPQEGEEGEEAAQTTSGSSEGEEADEESQGQGSDEESEGQCEQEGEAEDQDGLPGGDGAGSFTGKSRKWEPGTLDGLLESINQEVKEKVGHELDQRTQAVRSSERDYEVSSGQARFDERPPTTEHTTSSRGVEREMRRLQQKYKPGWNRRMETGKVDANQVANIRRGRTDVFKRFQPGVQNALDIEVVMLLDRSGSMYEHMREAGSALWVLHRAMKNIGAEVTVIGYSDSLECDVLMQRGSQTPKNVRDYWSGGATFVMPAMNEARRIFKASRRALKLMTIVTDGMFSDAGSVLEAMNTMQEPIAIVGINQNVRSTWDPDKIKALRVSKKIANPIELVPFTRDLVISLARERYGSVTK